MIRLVLVGCLALGVAGCNTDGGPIFGEGGSSNVNFGEAVDDLAPLSVKVKQALRRNGQTALARINVSQPSDDVVRLVGFVDNDAVKYEAERVAGNVDGVRYVMNDLDVSSR